MRKLIHKDHGQIEIGCDKGDKKSLAKTDTKTPGLFAFMNNEDTALLAEEEFQYNRIRMRFF